jgi:hypothetical protein
MKFERTICLTVGLLSPLNEAADQRISLDKSGDKPKLVFARFALETSI